MVSKKRLRFFGFFTLIIGILILGFVLAAHIVLPSSFTANESVQYIYNISVNNTNIGATANITQVNITIPNDFTFTADTNGTDAIFETFTNTSTVLSWTNLTVFLINGSSDGSGEKKYFWFNATALPGTYNITITVVNSTNSDPSNISVTINDTTNPIATLGTNPVANLNRSNSSTTFDLKCSDNYNISTLQLYGNWSSGWHANYTNNSYTNNTWLNTTVTGVSEGIYLWGVYCNDSAGNSNWTTNRTLTIDTTAPVVTHSCSPTDVYATETITCTCTAADAIDGSPTISYTASPSTSSTGSHTTTCTATDSASNSATSTISYIVGGIKSSGTSTPTISQWTNTHTISETTFEKGYTKELEIKNRIKFELSGQDHHVGVVSITTDKATIEIASDPVQVILDVGEDAKVDVTDDGFYDVYVLLNSIVNNKANVTIQKIHEEIPEEKQDSTIDTSGEVVGGGEPEKGERERNLTWLWILIAVIILIGIFYWWFVVKQNKKH